MSVEVPRKRMNNSRTLLIVTALLATAGLFGNKRADLPLVQNGVTTETAAVAAVTNPKLRVEPK